MRTKRTDAVLAEVAPRPGARHALRRALRRLAHVLGFFRRPDVEDRRATGTPRASSRTSPRPAALTSRNAKVSASYTHIGCGLLLEQQAVALLALGQFLELSVPFGGVALHRHQMGVRAVLVGHGHDVQLGPVGGAVLAVVQHFFTHRLPAGQARLDSVECGAVGVGALQQARRLADDLLACVTGDMSEGFVAVHDLGARRRLDRFGLGNQDGVEAGARRHRGELELPPVGLEFHGAAPQFQLVDHQRGEVAQLLLLERRQPRRREPRDR